MVRQDSVSACSCKQAPSPEAAREAAVAVFTGLVTAISLDTEWVEATAERPVDCRTLISDDKSPVALCEQADVTVRSRVFKSWKGNVSNELVVRTDSQGPACGVSFRVGQIYLVYAAAGEGGALRTSQCQRTSDIAEAQGDIDALGQPDRDFFSEGRQREHARP
jgi:hypothetical protein